MGSTSITTTTYGMNCLVVNPYFTLSKVDSVIFGQALSTFSYGAGGTVPRTARTMIANERGPSAIPVKIADANMPLYLGA